MQNKLKECWAVTKFAGEIVLSLPLLPLLWYGFRPLRREMKHREELLHPHQSTSVEPDGR